MVREFFPQARIGVVVPSHPYTSEVFLDGNFAAAPGRERQWLETLKSETFFDAVIIHLYSRLGMDKNVTEDALLPYPAAYANAVDHVEERLDSALDLLETTFPGKELWVTEYGLGGFRGAARKYGLRHAHLGGLHSGLMLLRFLARPSVTMSHWHSFTQCIAYDRESDRIRDQPTVQFEHLRLFGETVRRSQGFLPVTLVGAGADDIEAAAFCSDDGGYVMVLNKRAQTCIDWQLESVVPLRWTGAVQLAPATAMPLAQALASDALPHRLAVAADDVSAMTFPGYSITRLAFAPGGAIDKQKPVIGGQQK
jgi:hypothetical protein